MIKRLITMVMILTIILPSRATAQSCSSLIHIGDSTTVSMGKELERQYELRGFSNVIVSAGNGRSITKSRKPDPLSGIQAVNYWKARTPQGRCWVIALGTNDATATNKQERITLMKQALAGDKALWINVAMNSPTRPKYNGFNAIVWNLLLIHNGVDIYDWASVVKPEWFTPDKIHYTAEGSRQRATALANAADFQFHR